MKTWHNRGTETKEMEEQLNTKKAGEGRGDFLEVS
jgi:hypothetical protein